MSKIVRDVMQSEVHTVSRETALPELERRFATTKVGALPVVGTSKRLEGIVSRSDVMRRHSLERSLAELADGDFDQTLGVEDDDDALEMIGAAVGRRLAMIRAADIMIANVVTIEPDESLAEAARRMIERRIHRLPVVEKGQLVGIVSAFDFMRVYLDSPT
jgi:CBS domain-containing protein